MIGSEKMELMRTVAEKLSSCGTSLEDTVNYLHATQGGDSDSIRRSIHSLFPDEFTTPAFIEEITIDDAFKIITELRTGSPSTELTRYTSELFQKLRKRIRQSKSAGVHATAIINGRWGQGKSTMLDAIEYEFTVNESLYKISKFNFPVEFRNEGSLTQTLVDGFSGSMADLIYELVIHHDAPESIKGCSWEVNKIYELARNMHDAEYDPRTALDSYLQSGVVRGFNSFLSDMGREEEFLNRPGWATYVARNERTHRKTLIDVISLIKAHGLYPIVLIDELESILERTNVKREKSYEWIRHLIDVSAEQGFALLLASTPSHTQEMYTHYQAIEGRLNYGTGNAMNSPHINLPETHEVIESTLEFLIKIFQKSFDDDEQTRLEILLDVFHKDIKAFAYSQSTKDHSIRVTLKKIIEVLDTIQMNGIPPLGILEPNYDLIANFDEDAEERVLNRTVDEMLDKESEASNSPSITCQFDYTGMFDFDKLDFFIKRLLSFESTKSEQILKRFLTKMSNYQDIIEPMIYHTDLKEVASLFNLSVIEFEFDIKTYVESELGEVLGKTISLKNRDRRRIYSNVSQNEFKQYFRTLNHKVQPEKLELITKNLNKVLHLALKKPSKTILDFGFTAIYENILDDVYFYPIHDNHIVYNFNSFGVVELIQKTAFRIANTAGTDIPLDNQYLVSCDISTPDKTAYNYICTVKHGTTDSQQPSFIRFSEYIDENCLDISNLIHAYEVRADNPIHGMLRKIESDSIPHLEQVSLIDTHSGIIVTSYAELYAVAAYYLIASGTPFGTKDVLKRAYEYAEKLEKTSLVEEFSMMESRRGIMAHKGEDVFYKAEATLTFGQEGY